MRLLLDENLPKKLKGEFVGHRIFTIREKGWAGKSNGKLLQLMIEDKFDALITFDKKRKDELIVYFRDNFYCPNSRFPKPKLV